VEGIRCHLIVDVDDSELVVRGRVCDLYNDNVLSDVRYILGAGIDPFVDVKAYPRSSIVEVG
jgi:hypothetical protein